MPSYKPLISGNQGLVRRNEADKVDTSLLHLHADQLSSNP
jgi:hypothetical protein